MKVKEPPVVTGLQAGLLTTSSPAPDGSVSRAPRPHETSIITDFT